MHSKKTRTRLACTVFVIVGGLATPIAGSAQMPLEGQRVRIHQESSAVWLGSFMRIGQDSLWFLRESDATERALSRASIQLVEVRERRRARSGALRWGLAGLVAGSALGVAGCLPDLDRCKSRPNEPTGSAVLASAVFVALPVGGLGAIVGSLRPGHRWRAVTMELDPE